MIKIIHENHIIRPREMPEIVNTFFVDIENGVFPLFKKINPIKQYDLKNTLGKILGCLSYSPYGKNILDLGCGSNSNTLESDKDGDGSYGPHICRMLHDGFSKYGLKIVGVDCGNLDSEKFSYKKLDLLEENILVNNFKKHSFDLINASMLFNSPELEKRLTGKILNDASLESSIYLKSLLLPQIKCLLKSDGFFIHDAGSTFMNEDLFQNEPEAIIKGYWCKNKV